MNNAAGPKATITNRRRGVIDLFDFKIDVPKGDLQKLRENPEAFVRAAFEAAGQVVNDLVIGKEARKKLTETAYGPAGSIEGVSLHVDSPPNYKSKHILIVISN
jgi:hypothetical protein